MNHSRLREIKKMDAQRPGLPGEHWLALGAGVAVWVLSRSRRSLPLKLLGSVAGTLLVTRAFTGRDALGKRVGWLPRMH